MRQLLSPVVMVLASIFVFTGCSGSGLDYLVPLGAGEVGVLTRSVPVDDVLAKPELDPEMQKKLLLVGQVRQFAEQTLGLKVGQSYRFYYDTGEDPAMYNVSASPKDALAPLSWRFPIVGEIEYLGYFQRKLAEKKLEALRAQGYDVYLGRAIAYSTIGWLRDPIYSTMLDLDEDSLIETIIHELTHNTIYRRDSSKFNESVATFTGRQGAFEFLARTYGVDSNAYRHQQERVDDQTVVDTFMGDLYDELQAFYARTDLTSEQKIEQREQVFEAARTRFQDDILPKLSDPDKYGGLAKLPINNAWILMYYRYHKDLDIFEQVYQACDRNLAAAVVLFKQAVPKDDPYLYLRQWVTDHKQ